jgi:hypothetical protein
MEKVLTGTPYQEGVVTLFNTDFWPLTLREPKRYLGKCGLWLHFLDGGRREGLGRGWPTCPEKEKTKTYLAFTATCC